jgi:cytochrome c oxidase subunit 1
MDKVFGSSFFLPTGLVISGKPYDISGGGSPLLWQHLFWFLGHPEVYVLILPAMGVVAEVIACNTRKPLWGYKSLVYSVLAVGFISFIVWAHHMYLTGMGTKISTFFQTTTMIISIPSVIILTCLFMSLWGGSIRFDTPMLWAIGFLFVFTLGGVTGVVCANAGIDEVIHNTYYVVAHFHYVLSLGAVFSIFCGWYYWIGKMSGRQYPEFWGRVHFWMTFVGVNLLFFPQHFLGLAGMPRRYPDYPDAFAGWNYVSSIGSYISFASLVLFIYIVIKTLASKSTVPANQWGEGATTLEWQVASPPPFHTFEELPRIR